MSGKKQDNLKVGLTVFTGLVVLFIFTILVGVNSFLFSKTYNLYINLEDTAGLVNGAPVTLGGYKIGDVEAVEFVVVNNKTNIRIKLRIKDDYKEQIRADSKVKITSIGILGDKFVDITIGNPSFKPVPENSFLQVESALSLDNIAKIIAPGLERFNDIMDNLKNVTDSLSRGRGTIGQLINTPNTAIRLNNAIRKLDITLNSLENKKGSLNKLINDPVLYDDLTSTVGNLKTISGTLKDGHGTLGKMISDDSLYKSLINSSEQLSRFINKTQNDSTVIGGLLGDRKLYADVNDLIRELHLLINDIKAHPERYMKVSVF